MKTKHFFATILVMVCMFICESFTVNDQTNYQNEMSMGGDSQCYIVKLTFDIVWEYRTGRNNGTTVRNETKRSGVKITTQQCAYSESGAIDGAKYECHNFCNNIDGKYIQQTSDGYYIFEVRRITSAEVTGSCGDC